MLGSCSDQQVSVAPPSPQPRVPLQHVVGHHIFTNIDGADPDVYTDHPDKPFYLRIKWKQKWLPHYLYQHVYIFAIYSLVRCKGVCVCKGCAAGGGQSSYHAVDCIPPACSLLSTRGSRTSVTCWAEGMVCVSAPAAGVRVSSDPPSRC